MAGETVATICDIKLDEDTLDIAIENGDIHLIYDADVVAQSLRVKLRRILGEWYLNTASGTDYETGVFPKGAPYEATLRDAITSTPYVRALGSFEATLDVATRALAVTFEANTDFGPVSVHVETP